MFDYRGNPGILPPRLFPLAWGFPLLLLVFFLWLWGFRSCSWFFSSSEMCVYFLFLGFDQKADQPVCIELWHFQLPAPRKVPRCLHLIQGRHLVLKPTNFERGRIRPIWVSDLRKRPLIGVSRSLIYEQRTEPKPGARAHIALFQWQASWTYPLQPQRQRAAGTIMHAPGHDISQDNATKTPTIPACPSVKLSTFFRETSEEFPQQTYFPNIFAKTCLRTAIPATEPECAGRNSDSVLV